MIHLPRLAQVLLGRGTRPAHFDVTAYVPWACLLIAVLHVSLLRHPSTPKVCKKTNASLSQRDLRALRLLPQTLNPKPLNPKPLNPNPLELTIKPKLTDCAHKGLLEESIGAGSLQCGRYPATRVMVSIMVYTGFNEP